MHATYLSRLGAAIKNKFYKNKVGSESLRSFDKEIKRWFGDDGDNTLRLDYNLTPESIVFDLGGYKGDFTEKIFEKYSCYVYLFEPSVPFYTACVERFARNPKIMCFNFALSDFEGDTLISDSADASSLVSEVIAGQPHTEKVKVKIFKNTLDELGIDHIDLAKINIEGGEYNVLPHLMESQSIHKIKNLQIQFHNFVKNAERQRSDIRKRLSLTHENTWCYDFVWENWAIR